MSWPQNKLLVFHSLIAIRRAFIISSIVGSLVNSGLVLMLKDLTGG